MPFGKKIGVSQNIVTEAPTVGDGSMGGLYGYLDNPSPDKSDYFGRSLAVSDKYIIVGVPYDDFLGSNAGRVYIHDKQGALLRDLVQVHEATTSFFGWSVDVSGDYVVVGCKGYSSSKGEVYIFNASTGDMVHRIANPNPNSSDYFGESVSIDGNKFAVGAYGEDFNQSSGGSVYIFDLATGGELLRIDGAQANGLFGYSVSLSNDVLCVGEYGHSSYTGQAYLYDAQTGELLHALAHPEPETSDHFGYSVSIDDGFAVVGAPHEDTGASSSGSAYVFDTNSGSLLHSLRNPTPAIDDNFGECVCAYNGQVAIGATADDTVVTSTGAVHMYSAASGDLRYSLTNPEPTVTPQFGFSISMSDNQIVVGAPYDDSRTANEGRVFVFNPTNGLME